MSSEAHVKSFYLNISTRPTISKQKVHKLDLKQWETSLRDFNENKEPLSIPSSESNALYKELNLCKKKINEFPKKIFLENSHKSLKRKSISEKNIIETNPLYLNSQPLCSLSSDQYFQNEKKTIKNTDFDIQAIQATFEKKTLSVKCNPKFEQMRHVFSAPRSLKRKSMLGKNTIDTDLNGQTNLLCPFVQYPQKERRTCPLKNTSFNICNIQSTFQKKTISVRHTDVLLHDSNPKLEQCAMLEKVKDLKMPLSKHIFINPEEFSHDHSVQVLPKRAVFLTGSDGFRTAESLEEIKHKVIKIDHQEQGRNLLKTDLISALSAKGCSSSKVGVGSDWIHSLEQIREDHAQYEEGKKKIQNLLVGGYCEQILKFQRWELSEKAISEHRSGLKTTSDSVLMRINSIIHEYEIVVAECYLLHKSINSTSDVINSSFVLNEGLTYIALFQKSSFYKQQMKAGKSFSLFLPWHFVQLKCFKCPVIICKYFKVASREKQKIFLHEKKNTMKFQKQCHSVVDCYQSKMSKTSEYKQIEDMFYMWRKRVNICARIQRIWNRRISVLKLPKLLNDQNIYRLTLLLQTRNGEFFLLSTSSHHFLHTDWFRFVQGDEGHFYFFENLIISHRLEQKRYPKLFKYLQNMLEENKVTEVKQNFVYQLSIDGMSKKPSKIIEADLPPFLPFNFQSLSTVIKNPDGNASCKAKVLLQYRFTLYISDESIFHSGNILPYVKVFLPHTTSAISFSNSEICITEALIFEGNLYLDEYSQISCLPLSNVGFSTLNFRGAELSLRHDSNVADIVIVKGNITKVDENNACICLQCNFCMNESLLQNSEEIIFCEDCCVVVTQPLLNLKMKVIVENESLQSSVLNIVLLSQTIKEILSLKENSYPTQCNVSDVLSKEIGPLLCYIRGVDILESQRVFYLKEVKD